MTNSSNNNKNWGEVFLVAAIAGLFYGIFRAIRQLVLRSQETKKAKWLARKGFEDGLTEEQITSAFYDDVEKQMMHELTESEKDKIRNIVIREKEIFDKQKVEK